MSGPVLDPTQPPVLWIKRFSFSEVKRAISAVRPSPPSGAEFKKRVELNLHFFIYLRSVDRDKFVFNIITCN